MKHLAFSQGDGQLRTVPVQLPPSGRLDRDTLASMTGFEGASIRLDGIVYFPDEAGSIGVPEGGDTADNPINVTGNLAVSNPTGIGQPLVDKAVRRRIRHACFMLMDVAEGGQEYGVGTGVFYSRTHAVTALHNLRSHRVRRGDPVSIQTVATGSHSSEAHTLKIVSLHTGLDLAVLSEEGRPEGQEYLQLFSGDDEDLEMQTLVLCGFQLPLKGLLTKTQPYGLGFEVAQGGVRSIDKKHLQYTSNSFKGDSGGPLVTCTGVIVGIHLAGLNAVEDIPAECASASEESASTRRAISSVIANTGQKQEALLASAILDVLPKRTSSRLANQ